MTEQTTAKRKGRPSIRERAAERLCPNCGAPSPERRSSRGPAPLYCGPECKRAKNNRDLADGLGVINYLKAWRADRGSGEIAKESFARLCRIIDNLNEQDRAAGRPRADYVAAVAINSQKMTVDDLRYGRRKVEESRNRAPELALA